MNNDYRTDPYLRIMTIISLLNESDSGFSVFELSEQLGVSEEIIIEDLKNIHISPEVNSYVVPFDEEYEIEESEMEEDDDIFLKRLFNGEMNDIKIDLSKDLIEQTFSVELSEFERIILSYFLEENNLHGIIPKLEDIYIKNERKNDFKVLKIISEINEDIRSKCYVDIILKQHTITKKIISAIPIKVVNLFSTEEYYMIVIDRGEVRNIKIEDIDRIIVGDKIGDYPNEIIDKIIKEYEYRWGISDETNIFDFEMKVFDEARVINKLKSQLSYRKYGAWRDYEGYSIYSDKVIDYEALKMWVMGYGSSVIVLKPEKMAKEIVEKAKERVNIYNEILK